MRAATVFMDGTRRRVAARQDGAPGDAAGDRPTATGRGRVPEAGARVQKDVADLVRRRDELLDEVSRRSRSDARTRLRRLRIAAPLIAQSALAAGGAWYLANRVGGRDHVPFFAPVAAVISLGSALGLRLRRAVELVLGVALGIGVGDALMRVVGTGTLQLVGIVALAMTVAVLIDGGQIIVLQAATSSVLVATLVPVGGGAGGADRFLDALLGGAVGIAVSLLLLPLNPVSVARRHVEPVIEEIAGGLTDVATALETGDADAAMSALTRARAAEPLVTAMRTAVGASGEIARIAPARWRSRDRISAYCHAATFLDYAARNTRVLARRAGVLLRAGEPVPAELPAGIRLLAEAAREVGRELAGEAEPTRSRRLLVEAAALVSATGRLGRSAEVVVAQARSVAFDLLMATGVEREDALALMARDTPRPT
jgi:uncharacterized membrane protein YgaE (UPF0421/DUF939 family)